MHHGDMDRRDILAQLGLALVSRLAGAPSNALSVRLPEAGDVASDRQYRVDATILLLGAPVFRRAGVGEARMSLRIGRGAAARRIALEFAAASDPKRAHGLNRLGWIRETVVEHGSEPASATVLGIMSDSPEKDASEARKALAQKGESRFVAIDSEHAPGGTRSRVARFAGAAGPGALRVGMADTARRNLDGNHQWKRTGRDGVANPFLYSIMRLMETGRPTAEGFYVYNEEEYRLRLERTRDSGASERIKGVLRNQTRRLKPLQFQFWVDRGSVSLPSRIEFQPQSFLQLRLVAVDSGDTPSSRPLADCK
jgi:hypothetical protein